MNLNHYTSRWYAVYTYPRHEQKVFKAFESREIESFLPSYREVHLWRNGVKKEVDLPLFPGYVFASFVCSDRFKILNTPSVASLVGPRGEPTALLDSEIQAIRFAIPQLHAEPHPFLQTGDRVRVRSGPLAGTEGILVKKKDSWRFVLCMDLIRQAVSVEVDCVDIDPVPVRVPCSNNVT